MKKEHIKTILECIFVFIVVYIFNTFFYNNGDHLIDFTHCYSVANNQIIYKDFNIVVGPIYPVFISIFLRIFGKNFIVFHIVNSSFIVFIYLMIKKHYKNTLAILVITCCATALSAKYNLFTLLLFYMIYYTEKGNNKYKDYTIGFLLSIMTFTKINMGFFLIIPTLILYFKKPKIILKRFISFLIPSILIILTLFLYGALPGFINYTLLGLISFTKNAMVDFTIIILILAVIYVLKNIKKDKYLIYMLCYMMISYPLFESGHIIIGVFPTIVYSIDKLKNKNSNHNKRIAVIAAIIFFLISFISNYIRVHNISDYNNYKNYNFTKIDCKNSYCSQDVFINAAFNSIHSINPYLQEKKKEYRIYYFVYEAYIFKLDAKEKIDKYDYIWNGNMGYKGEDTYIKEIKKYCKNHKCMFVICKNDIYKRNEFNILNLKILKFVENNYKELKNDKKFKNKVYSLYTND